MKNEKQNTRMQSASGFTLVELLLVVTILGILAAVVVVNFRGQGETARINTTRASIAAIGTAINTYEVSTGSIPESLDELTTGTEARPALLKKDSLIDSWGNAFQYKKVGKYDFEVRSAGPDKQVGTPDDLWNQ